MPYFRGTRGLKIIGHWNPDNNLESYCIFASLFRLMNDPKNFLHDYLSVSYINIWSVPVYYHKLSL
jgi:hypothetical protein